MDDEVSIEVIHGGDDARHDFKPRFRIKAERLQAMSAKMNPAHDWLQGIDELVERFQSSNHMRRSKPPLSVVEGRPLPAIHY